MNTGAMTGADVPALRALAGQMSASAARLDGMRQSVRARLYSINWQGPDGADFRRAWDGQHAPMLSRVAEGLRASAQNLLREAAQQEAASGSNGGVGAAAGALGGRASAEAGRLFSWADIAKSLGILFGTSEALKKALIKDLSNRVPRHLRDGAWIEAYQRWSAGRAEDLNRFFGSAQRQADELAVMGKIGKFLPLVGGAFDVHEQWQDDEGEYAGAERAARAAAGAAAVYGVETAITTGFTAAGTFLIPIPGVGTMVGAATGLAVAGVVTGLYGDQITDGGAWVASRVIDGAEFVVDAHQAAVDLGGEVLERGQDLLDAGGQLAEEAGESVGNFVNGLTAWRPAW